jgi:hypothetical protein
MARYPLFQHLQCCTNVTLASARNSDLIDDECLAANISITAHPVWAITRAVLEHAGTLTRSLHVLIEDLERIEVTWA